MRIALFSDIHGNVTGLKAVLAAIERRGVDLIVAAGDLIGGESGTDEVLDLLREREVRCVQGDSDTIEKLLRLEADALARPGTTRSPAWFYRACRQWTEENLSEDGRMFLEGLPLSLTIDAAPGQRLYVCHASPRSTSDRVCAPFCDVATFRDAFGGVDAQIVAYGHAHEAHVRVLDGRPHVNVASVGFRPDGLASLTFLTCVEDHWQIVQHQIPFDAAEERRRCLDRGVPPDPSG